MIRPKANSFTLVEMIGAMAILAILASVLAPSVVRQIQTATSVGEDANLADIAQALTNGIRATGIIPNPNLNPTNTNANGFGWAYLASNYTRLAGSKLVSVFPGMTNETGRRLYLSTNLVALASQGGFANTVSNWGATLFPTNAKMYLVSASRPEFNLLLATNGAGAQTNDNSYASAAVNSLDSWVKQFSTNGVTVAPTNIVDPSWTNRGEFLHVRTIDLAPIFSEVKAAQQKAIEQEDKNLEEIARSLVAAIKANGQIPDPNGAANAPGGWFTLAQSFTSLGSTDLINSFGTNAATQRRYYLSLNMTNYIQTQNGNSYNTQTNGWSTNSFPADIYFVLVSSSKEDLVLDCPAAGNLNAAGASWLKNWLKKPDSSGIYQANNTDVLSWTNRGEFLHVKTVDLKPLFCRVELIDTACPPTATISSGSGYAIGDVITFNVGSFPFSFTATGTSFGGQAGNLAGNPPQMLKKPFSSSTTTDPRSGSRISGSSSGIDAIATLLSTPAPQFQINNLAAQPFGAGNTMVFYVLKGTSLSLLNNAGATLITLTVQGDSIFKYFNSTWSKVD